MQSASPLAKIGNSVMTKLLMIGLLVSILLIPLTMIQGVITERSLRKQGAVEDVSRKWGGEQSIAGPILSVPYKIYQVNDKGIKTARIEHAHFLPEDLSIKGIVQPYVRYRGIYEVVLYSSELQISAIFHKIRFKELGIDENDVLWDRAFLSMGIPDLKGLKKNNVMTWDKKIYPLNSGIESVAFTDSGISTRVPVSNNQEQYSFNMNININGSGQLAFYPFGKVTTVQLSSPWRSPSFTGSFLPDERIVNDNGFTAKWHILHLNRNYPQRWIGQNEKVSASFFGVKLFYPVDEYQKSERSVKYAILFIVLTFISFS